MFIVDDDDGEDEDEDGVVAKLYTWEETSS